MKKKSMRSFNFVFIQKTLTGLVYLKYTSLYVFASWLFGTIEIRISGIWILVLCRNNNFYVSITNFYLRTIFDKRRIGALTVYHFDLKQKEEEQITFWDAKKLTRANSLKQNQNFYCNATTLQFTFSTFVHLRL